MRTMSCEFCRCQPDEPVHDVGCPKNIDNRRQRRDAAQEWEKGFRDAMDGVGHTRQGDSYLLGYSRGQKGVVRLQKSLEPSDSIDCAQLLKDFDSDEFLDEIFGPVSDS